MDLKSDTYWQKIFIAGDPKFIEDLCQEFCTKIQDLCVTVTPTTYVYKYGRQEGAIIGLINYPRFPCTKDELRATATKLADFLLDKTNNASYSIMGPDETIYSSLMEKP